MTQPLESGPDAAAPCEASELSERVLTDSNLPDSTDPHKLARVHSRALLGIHAPAVEVEVHVSNGLPAFHIVGLPETSVRESRDRVRAAILNSGFDFPNRRLTVNLAPADLPKDSGRFDLPIAIGVLVATGQVPPERLANRVFIGELSLSGDTRPIRGALALALALVRDPAIGVTDQPPQSKPADSAAPAIVLSAPRAQLEIVLPRASAAEAGVVPGLRICTARSLTEVTLDLKGEDTLPALNAAEIPTPEEPELPDMADIKGHEQIKTGLEVAAAGGHNALLIGPPGSGKSTIAHLTRRFDPARWRQRPFRAPHHSASMAALVGGGSRISPGEISLAHHGVLFLDELPEFGPRTLDSLREPLETGSIALARAARQIEFPARFQLVAAMNPCPCGHYGTSRCRCTPDQVSRYQQRLSGPLLDRIDIQLWVGPVTSGTLLETRRIEPSAAIAERVARARERQLQRQGCPNARLDAPGVQQHCELTDEAQTLLLQTAARLHWSARVFHRLQKLARTAADLQASDTISTAHVAQAIGYRRALGS